MARVSRSSGRSTVWTALGAVAVLCSESSRAADFKRFPETISPDGRYALAWRSAKAMDPAAPVAEVPYADKTFDEENSGEEVANYLVDLAEKKVVARLPDFDFFRGAGIRKNRGDIEIAWAPDARSALAVCQTRFGSAAVVWIEPQAAKAEPVQKELAAIFAQVLRKSEPELAGEVGSEFRDIAFVGDGTIVVHASGSIPKGRGTSEYRLKLRVLSAGEDVRFQLEESRRLMEYGGDQSSNPEAELNSIYTALRKNLVPPAREALREEQLRWLRLREGIADADVRATFTRHRIVELRARADLP